VNKLATRPSTDYAYLEYTRSGEATNHSYLWPPVLNALRPLAGSGARVLDAGCGNGAFCSILQKNLGLEAYGCDLSESGVEIATKNYPDCRFQQLSVYDDFATAFGTKFDAIISIEVIEHLYDPLTFLRRVRESLNPGGLFVITTPYHGYLKNLLIAVTGHSDRHHNPLYTGGHIKFWSRRTLTSALERAGFREITFAGTGRLPYLWKSMVLAAKPGEPS
jgi:2-polyprenyl-3-methyl-5-hydroxy-6-metoxy-1,4-benzoquinol methylase